MQKLTLSTNIDRLTTEIKTYQTIGGQAIFEIGRRLKWVKDNDLTHGEYGKWLESISMNHNTANRFEKVATELSNSGTYHNLGINALYLIATMPESERDKPQQLDSGEVKKPDEMTVRELRETKKKLKERDSQIEELKNQPPKVVEKKVETVPDDYQQLKRDKEQSEETIRSLKIERDKYKKGSADFENLKSQISELEDRRDKMSQAIQAGGEIMYMNGKLKKLFATKLAATKYADLFTEDPISSTIDETRELVETVREWVNDMDKKLPQEDRKIINVEE